MNWFKRFRKSTAYTQANIVCTIIIAVATVAYAVIAHRQLHAMNDQLEMIRKSSEESSRQFQVQLQHFDAGLGRSDELSKHAADQAGAARDAITQSRAQFIADDRPYIAMIPGDVGEVKMLAEGPHAGELEFKFNIENFGKSPAIWLSQDVRIAVGPEDAKDVIFHPSTEYYRRIIPPGGKPTVYAYSRVINKDPKIGESTHLDDPVIMYGHFEYTDTLGSGLPYVSGICAPVKLNGNHDIEKTCEKLNYMR